VIRTQVAVGTASWSAAITLSPGSYSARAFATDSRGLVSPTTGLVAFTVPAPPPGPLFSETFETSGLSQFTVTGPVTVNTTAGGHPGTTGTRGAHLDDTSRITSRAIDTRGVAALRLTYWMSVNSMDSNEFGYVDYCVASCGTESNWANITRVGGNTGWRTYDHALPAAAGNQAALQLRWRSTANGFFDSRESVYVDDIVLTRP
jgi:hypothetical protein